jgi:serine protease Do
MIPNTLTRTKNATFSILVPHPNPAYQGFPTANGTGFFISSDGYFITARHVLFDFSKIMLNKPELFTSLFITGLQLVKEWTAYDLVLLKANFDMAKTQKAFKEKTSFDYLDIEYEVTPEGTDVYSFGYPLAQCEVKGTSAMLVGFHYDCPRVTSAVISSHYDVIGPVRVDSGFPRNYVIDKALNYGNSGGPLVLQQSGKAIAVITRFQPVNIPQQAGSKIMIPSLYGIASSLKNIENDLKSLIKP